MGPENSLVRSMYDPEKLVEQATLTSEHTIFCEIGNKDYGRMIEINSLLNTNNLSKLRHIFMSQKITEYLQIKLFQ